MIITDLPNEILCLIFQLACPEELWKNCRAVCKRFHSILHQDTYWVSRANVKLPDRLKPIIIEEQTNNDVRANISHGIRQFTAAQSSFKKWSLFNSSGEPFVSNVHFSTVDAIKLFYSKSTHRSYCYTGARDRMIIAWDMNKINTGWIWSLDVSEDERFLYSSGWDSSIKEWQRTDSQIINTQKISFETAVLSTISEGESILYASTYNSGPILFDLRVGINPVKSLKVHGNHSSGSNFIYTISEDRRLVSVDKRMFVQPVHLVQYTKRLSKVDNTDNFLGLSFRDGTLQFLHPQTLSMENEINLNDSSQNNKNNDHISHSLVKCSLGSTACGYNQKIKIYTSGITPVLIANMEIKNMITITKVCF